MNFGHTLGHAIEKEMNFTLSHGACVAAGSVAAARISCSRGLISEEELRVLRSFLTSSAFHKAQGPSRFPGPGCRKA